MLFSALAWTVVIRVDALARQELEPLHRECRMLALNGRALQGLYPNFDSDAVADHLAGFRLRDQMAIPIGKMSTGTRRKVWLTAALVVGCATVLLDEPMNALDGNSSLYLRQRLNRAAMQRERCWIVASHVEPCQDVSVLNTLTLP